MVFLPVRLSLPRCWLGLHDLYDQTSRHSALARTVQVGGEELNRRSAVSIATGAATACLQAKTLFIIV